MVDASAAAQFITSGKLNGILVTSAEPVPILPGVPTVGSLGHPEDETYIWHAFLVKAGTPPDIVRKIEAALARLPEDKDFAAFLKAASVDWSFAPGAEFAPKVQAEMDRIRESLALLKGKAK